MLAFPTRSARRLALALPLLLPGLAALAQPVPITIAAGPSGGTYRDVYAPNLGKLLHGYRVLERTTSGSGENLDLLLAGEVEIAFAQADVYAAGRGAEAARYEELVVAGKLADECVYVAYRKAGPVRTLEELSAPVRGRPAVVAVGPEHGGSAATWAYLTTLVPGLRQAETRPEGGTLALNQLAAGAYDAVLWVTDPTNFDHHSLRTVLGNDELGLMPLASPAFERSLPDGTYVYRAAAVELAPRWRAPKLQTICTSALVFVRRDADPALVQKIADAIALHLDRIVPQNRPTKR